MNELEKLIEEVSEARNSFIETASKILEENAQLKPSSDAWSASEIVEHICWAEVSGTIGMLKALQAYKEGRKIFDGEIIHQGLSVEEIVARTWKPKEIVPPIAAPRFGGPIGYWLNFLENLQKPLEDLGKKLEGIDLASIQYPHPISGPMDIRQRLQFLRFHLDRHQNQLIELKLF